MWFVRALICFVAFSVPFPHHGVLGSTSPEYSFETASNPQTSYMVKLMGDAVRVSSTVWGSPELAEFAFGEHYNLFINILSNIKEFFTQMDPVLLLDVARDTLKIISDVHSGLFNWEKSSVEFLLTPLHQLSNIIFGPLDGRIKFIEGVFEDFHRPLSSLERQAVINFANFVPELARKAYFDGVKIDSSESLFNRNNGLIMDELFQRGLDFFNVGIYMALFGSWSFDGFYKVYSQIDIECSTGEDELKYIVIEGESYEQDEFLHEVINKANINRKEACRMFKLDKNSHKDGFKFISDQFMQVVSAKTGHYYPIAIDVLMVDAFAQNMLGKVKRDCVLSFLCKAGSIAVKHKHPIVHLLLGIFVSGRTTNFGENFDMWYLNELGTPKMAEAIYRGYNNDCRDYAVEARQCLDPEKFIRMSTDTPEEAKLSEALIKGLRNEL